MIKFIKKLFRFLLISKKSMKPVNPIKPIVDCPSCRNKRNYGHSGNYYANNPCDKCGYLGWVYKEEMFV
jgi:hypothetical protein